MKYKIISAFFIILLLLGVGTYFIKPELYSLNNPMYDIFYTEEALEQRIEDRDISTFPVTMGRLALSGPTGRGVGVTVDRYCALNDTNICSKMYRLEYRDYKGDAYFINISKIKEGKSASDAKQYLSSLSKSNENGYYKFEKHEIGWVSEEKNTFIVVQKGICSIVNNTSETCSYPNPVDASDEIVAQFVKQYPVSN